MRRYLTTLKLFGGAAAIIMALVLDTDSVAAKNLLVGPLTTAGQSIAGAVVCLGSTPTNRTHGPQTTGSGGITNFTNVSETQAVYINVMKQGIGTAQRVMGPGTEAQVLVTVPSQFAVPAAVQNLCVAAPAGGTTTTTLPPAPGAQPSPGVLQPIPAGQAHALAARAQFFGNALYPVYSHPRCVNCHGGVNAATGANHGGGAQTGSCLGCHQNAPPNWHVPPANLSFVGKNWVQICQMVKAFAGPIGRAGLNTHVSGDLLIGWAFAPTGIRNSPSANPNPPLQAAGSGNRNAFVTNSLRWFDDGMQCGFQPFRR